MDGILTPSLVEVTDSTRDRISSLEDDLLSQTLCFLPTKEAVAMSSLSKTMMRRVFSLITTLDFDDSPISHCVECPRLVERYHTYKHFVDTVLRVCHDQQYLTSFRLRLGRIQSIVGDQCPYRYHACSYKGDGRCFPHLDPTHLNAWMCYPLTRKVRELDLSIHVSEPRGHKLPLEIFTCETLEVLKLDVNLETTQESFFCLPNLKLLHLSSLVIGDDEFVTRLVSSCPLLEDLTLQYCTWKHEDFITISSPSLRRLVLNMMEGPWGFTTHHDKPSEVVCINTPNLQSLTYFDNLACECSITNMNAIVTAEIVIVYVDPDGELLSLLRALSNVQHLSLEDSCMESLNSTVSKDQLPMFRNLSYLELGCNEFANWDQALLSFLHCSPFLVTLVFPEGLSGRAHLGFPILINELEAAELEPQAWRTTQIPSCCRSHLKRIVIKNYKGSERELDLIAFLLRNTSVLEELVAYQSRQLPAGVDQMSLQSTLKNLPRASINCSIRVHMIN